MDNYLVHHGILGQKWGVQNGPPYPLSKSDMSSSEKKHYNVDPHELRKNMDQMSDQELQRAINRINLQNTVESLDRSTVKKGKNAVLSDLRDFNNLSTEAIKAFNTIKKIGLLLG